jgi:hypothetical protein
VLPSAPMPRRKLAKLLETNLLWGCVGLFCFALGILCSVVATLMRDMRPLLWVAFLFFGIPLSAAIFSTMRSNWKRLCLIILVWALLFIGTDWLYKYVPPEVSMAREETHETEGGFSEFHDLFKPGNCISGVPEVTREIQWTWFLKGPRFGCASNEYKSWATIDFDPRVYGAAETHASPLISEL